MHCQRATGVSDASEPHAWDTWDRWLHHLASFARHVVWSCTRWGIGQGEGVESCDMDGCLVHVAAGALLLLL